MPQLPVTCPHCAAGLTVGRELLNRPVGCGACGRAFVPVMDPGGREPDDLPPRRRPRGHGGPLLGILSLILAVLGIGTCCLGPLSFVLSGAAVVTGLLGLRGRGGRAMSVFGLVLGLMALGLRLVFFLVFDWRQAFELW